MYILEFKPLLPTLNQTKRMNRWTLASIKKRWSKAIKMECIRKKYTIKDPFEKAKITIKRYSVRQPDYDNMVGGAKEFIDLFTTPTMQANGHIKNKFGHGFIIDDSPQHLKTCYEWTKSNLCDQKTIIVIEPQ